MLPDFTELLTLAGFKLQRGRRATCAWCSGHDPATASYTNSYVHCFRCNQTKGYVALAREFGILKKQLSDTDRAKLSEISAKEKRRTEFLAWQNSKLRNILKKLDALNSRAKLAHYVLQSYPEDELAWKALQNLYAKEALLFAAFDFFSLAQVSNWLEEDSTPKELVALFNEQAR